MSNTPPIPAGWYPDPNNSAQLRYWDGAVWTDHYAPATPTTAAPPAAETAVLGVASPTPPAAAPQPPPFQPPVAATAQAPGAGTGFGGWWGRLSGGAKALLMIGAAVVVILIFSSIGAALRGPGAAEPAVVTVTATPEAVPETSPEPEPSAEAEPAEPVVVDVPAFKSEANGHLDDMSKDLDDMVVTVNENGFFRLISNSVELSFNVAQLEILDVPESIAVPYAEGATGLTASVDSMNDPISNEDNATLLAIIETMRGQVQAMHDLVNSAT